jgi:ribosomal protein S19E (S16A)
LKGKSFEEVLNLNSLNSLQKEGFIQHSKERIKITKKGYPVLDSVVSYLIKDFKI